MIPWIGYRTTFIISYLLTPLITTVSLFMADVHTRRFLKVLAIHDAVEHYESLFLDLRPGRGRLNYKETFIISMTRYSYVVLVQIFDSLRMVNITCKKERNCGSPNPRLSGPDCVPQSLQEFWIPPKTPGYWVCTGHESLFSLHD